MLVLRGGTVVDADGARTADVAVEGGSIAAVGDVDADPDRELDVSDRFVAPGLIDTHVHLAFDGRPDVSTYRTESPYAGAYRVAANLRRALDAGVTTVRDLGSWGSMAVDAGRAVADGTIPGPRVVAAGEAVTMTGGHGHWFGREADGADEVRAAAREQLKRGADVVKCIATGGVLTPGTRTGAPELTRAELDAAAAVADAADVPSAAHAHGREGIVAVAEAGIDSVEHGTFMDRAAADLLAERGTRWVPTASALHSIVDAGSDAGIPAEAVAKAETALDAFDEAFDHAREAGVRIAMGTDAGTPFNEFGSIPAELGYLVDHGLSPAAALEAATVEAASLLGLSDVGRVEAGYRADLVVLDGNPLDDPTAWEAPTHVLTDGTVHRT
ncbi:metal-dependent hydrolase family protein [Salinilacihabitans rarus]|uniref:metal-dependent hydrolase family protein n=1 Tax=Salinilacihabitans rarus TaxID=2961596 RepID=UPI0020C92453|nr:amidohydrolase family protein [Salinilacihabitans rarus]